LCHRALGEQEEIPLKILQPRPDGYFKGWTIDFAKISQVANRYYELMGVDPVTHLPLRKELERLGLKDVADMLENLPSRETQAAPEGTSKEREGKA
jgi:hypothetical protein